MPLDDNPILGAEQRRFLAAFARSPLAWRYYLTGGTALAAFHLQHRLSDDLDLFAEEPAPIEELLAFLREHGFPRPDYQHVFDRRIFLLHRPDGSLKVEFTRYPFPRLETGLLVEGLRIDSLCDILANKLVALTDRSEPKDLVDLYVALRERPDLDLDRLIDDAEGKFGVQGVRHILRGRFLAELPPLGVLEMRKAFEPAAMQEFFSAAGRRWVRRAVEGEPGGRRS